MPEERKNAKVWRALHVSSSVIGHIPGEPHIPAATLPLSPGKKRYFVNVAGNVFVFIAVFGDKCFRSLRYNFNSILLLFFTHYFFLIKVKLGLPVFRQKMLRILSNFNYQNIFASQNFFTQFFI